MYFIFSILYYIVLNERGLGGHIFFDDSFLLLPFSGRPLLVYCIVYCIFLGRFDTSTCKKCI